MGIFIFKFYLIKKIYLYALSLGCGMSDLAPWPGIKPSIGSTES